MVSLGSLTAILVLIATLLFCLLLAGEDRRQRSLRLRERCKRRQEQASTLVKELEASLAPILSERQAALNMARAGSDAKPPQPSDLSRQAEARIPSIVSEIETHARANPQAFSQAIRFYIKDSAGQGVESSSVVGAQTAQP